MSVVDESLEHDTTPNSQKARPIRTGRTGRSGGVTSATVTR